MAKVEQIRAKLCNNRCWEITGRLSISGDIIQTNLYMIASVITLEHLGVRATQRFAKSHQLVGLLVTSNYCATSTTLIWSVATGVVEHARFKDPPS